MIDNECLIAIDQSITSSGICVFDTNGELIEHQVIGTKPADYSGLDYPVFYRAKVIADEVERLMTIYKVCHFCIEGLAFGKAIGNATRDLAILQGMIMAKVIAQVKPGNIIVVTPTTLKKFASGNGAAKKDEMYDSLPSDIKDEFSFYKKTKGRYDVTDAYFIGKYYLHEKSINSLDAAFRRD